MFPWAIMTSIPVYAAHASHNASLIRSCFGLTHGLFRISVERILPVDRLFNPAGTARAIHRRQQLLDPTPPNIPVLGP